MSKVIKVFSYKSSTFFSFGKFSPLFIKSLGRNHENRRTTIKARVKFLKKYVRSD